MSAAKQQESVRDQVRLLQAQAAEEVETNQAGMINHQSFFNQVPTPRPVMWTRLKNVKSQDLKTKIGLFETVSESRAVEVAFKKPRFF